MPSSKYSQDKGEKEANVEAQLDKVVMLPQLIESIKTHSRLEATKGAEAVGFLAQRHGTKVISTSVPLNNHSSDRAHGFFVEPWEQFRAEAKLEETGYTIAGVYHSHPNSEAFHSAADRAMARPGELMVIYSVTFDELNAWREDGGELLPVVLDGRV